jgi:hypothetical protein
MPSEPTGRARHLVPGLLLKQKSGLFFAFYSQQLSFGGSLYPTPSLNAFQKYQMEGTIRREAHTLTSRSSFSQSSWSHHRPL